MTLIWPNPFQNKLVRVIDTETTGVAASSAVVEIGSVDFDNGNPPRNPMQQYVDPKIPIELGAMAVHHITEAMVQNQPEIHDAVEDFKGADFYVAHNAPFDSRFLSKFFPNKPWICTLKLARQCWPDAEAHKLQYLRYYLGLCPELKGGGHDAITDVTLTHALLCRILVEEEWQLEDLVAISNNPQELPRIPFGKHKGKKFSEVPRDYLQWILRGNFSIDIQYSAKKALGWIK